jgi:hypothetical protein
MVPSRTKRFAYDRVKHLVSEVRVQKEATRLVRENEGFVRENRGLMRCEQSAETRREFHDSLAAGLGGTEVRPTGIASRNAGGARVQIYVNPAEGSSLAETATRVGKK